MRHGSMRLAALATTMLYCLAGSPAWAVDWESLVNPGAVVEGHAKTEAQCRKCHAPFARDDQRKLCLDCHKDVGGDIARKGGFHGRFEPARTGQCRNCHTDHEGRDADIVRLTPQTFNHAMTDYPLKGGHARVACGECHEPKAKHREAPGTCIGCHAPDDPHRKALGEDCASCHTVERWKDTRFDHAKATENRYPLTGAHATTDCGLCHSGQRYKDTPTTCIACHRIDDAHQGARGEDCKSCHSTKEWKEPTFDHLKRTGFALTAGHAKVACQACHTGNNFEKTNGKTCVDCHRSDDAHKGRNGPECKDCHSTSSWTSSRFDHAKQTKFALNGAHSTLTCVACHKGAAKTEKLDKACVACHREDDAHKEALGTDCAACHGEKEWRADIRFDHDLTKFPLAGLHATTACVACHADRKFRGTPVACLDCHRKDDVHKGALGKACQDCHTPNDWRIWTFDHDTRTDFPLTGAHSTLRCASCHVRPPGEGRPMSDDCGTCHRRDDVHGGQFGSDCARCHNTRTFSGATRNSR